MCAKGNILESGHVPKISNRHAWFRWEARQGSAQESPKRRRQQTAAAAGGTSSSWSHEFSLKEEPSGPPGCVVHDDSLVGMLFMSPLGSVQESSLCIYNWKSQNSLKIPNLSMIKLIRMLRAIQLKPRILEMGDLRPRIFCYSSHIDLEGNIRLYIPSLALDRTLGANLALHPLKGHRRHPPRQTPLSTFFFHPLHAFDQSRILIFYV